MNTPHSNFKTFSQSTTTITSTTATTVAATVMTEKEEVYTRL